MKTKSVFLIALFLPLFAALLLAVAGIRLHVWVYVILATVCLLAAGVVWFIYKDMEKKIKHSEKGGEHLKRSG